MSKFFLIQATVFMLLVSSATVPCPVTAQQQQQGAQSQKSDQPGPGRFFRRLRDELRGKTEEEKEAERKEQIANERDRAARGQQPLVPTPAVRPGTGVSPLQGRFDGVRMPGPESAEDASGPANANLYDSTRSAGVPTPAARTNNFSAERTADGTGQGSGFGLRLVDSNGEVAVQEVSRGGNAQSSGIRRGDKVVSVGGVPIKSATEFDEISQVMSPGDQIELEIARNGKEEKVLLQFGSSKTPETASPSAPHELSLAGPPLIASGSAPDFVPNDRSPVSGVVGSGVSRSRSVVSNANPEIDPIVANQAQTIGRLQQTVQQQQAVIEQLQQQLQSIQNSNRRRN